jgi:hypothetical protein
MNVVTLCGKSEGLMAFGLVPEAHLSEASGLEKAFSFFDFQRSSVAAPFVEINFDSLKIY